MAAIPWAGVLPPPDPAIEEAALRRIREEDAERQLYEREQRRRAAEAERRRHDELVARHKRNGRLIRGFILLSVLAGIVAFAVVVTTWVADGVNATVASTPATKRSLVTATTAGWQWGMIAMAASACIFVFLVAWSSEPRD